MAGAALPPTEPGNHQSQHKLEIYNIHTKLLSLTGNSRVGLDLRVGVRGDLDGARPEAAKHDVITDQLARSTFYR